MTILKEAWRVHSRAAHLNSEAKGFWDDYDESLTVLNHHATPKVAEATKLAFLAQKLKLIGDEVAEANEALRDGNPPSKKAAGFSCLEEELADVVIRIWDLEGKLGLDVVGAIEAKMKRNATRPRMHGREF